MRCQLGGVHLYQERSLLLHNQSRRATYNNNEEQVRVPFSGSARRHRSGFNVFVNFVSKRIHPFALSEAFSVYGRVVDVFISFNNPKRLKSMSTFVFIWFALMVEVEKDVRLGNNRRMNGFVIKVFLEKKHWLEWFNT
ncbi:hypothetical protein V6N13_099277 [Hibiscus sabdariffa]|uniref:RRM domain-containing protein n=1 Tax=Hibiscus sabdariffa TaxID=183260 RepID=A0ABR2PZP8_9ROSI